MEGYTKVKKLGAGAFGSIYLVRDDSTGEELVLKKIPCSDFKAANAALQEVKLLLKCTHQGIIAYSDFSLASGSDDAIVINLLMEFCDGGDLWERVAAAQKAKELIHPPLYTGWILQITDALRYLHSRNILHRDIKLENIMISGPDHNSVAKLGDFGLAKALSNPLSDDGTIVRTSTKCGTPDYMAPEVLEGRSYSAPAEVFSLGVVLYALASVRIPTMLAIEVSQGKPLAWNRDYVPCDELQTLVGRMLQVREDDRPLLDEIATRVAEFPAARMLEGSASYEALAAASTQYPCSGLKSQAASPMANRRAPPAVRTRTAASTPRTSSPRVSFRDVPDIIDIDNAELMHHTGSALGLTIPSQPVVRSATPKEIILDLQAPPAGDTAQGYRVLVQEGRSGGFRELIADTGTASTEIVVNGLQPGQWYEFKVSSHSDAGSSALSAASRAVYIPEVEGDVPRLSRRGSSVSAMSACSSDDLAGGVKLPSGRALRRTNSRNSQLFDKDHGGGNTDKEKADAAFKACRVQLLEWDKAWEATHGCKPTEVDRKEDSEYQSILTKYRQLRLLARRPSSSSLAPSLTHQISAHLSLPPEGAARRTGGAVSHAPSPGASPLNRRVIPPCNAMAKSCAQESRSPSGGEAVNVAIGGCSEHRPVARPMAVPLSASQPFGEMLGAAPKHSLPAALYVEDDSPPTTPALGRSGKLGRRIYPGAKPRLASPSKSSTVVPKVHSSYNASPTDGAGTFWKGVRRLAP